MFTIREKITITSSKLNGALFVTGHRCCGATINRDVVGTSARAS